MSLGKRTETLHYHISQNKYVCIYIHIYRLLSHI